MNEFHVRFLKEEEYNTWDRLVDHSDHGTIFHKYDWNRAIYASDPAVSLNLAGCFKGEELVAGIITGSKRKFGLFKTMIPPYASSFYGLVLKERDTEFLSKAENFRNEVLNTLLSFMRKEFHIGSFTLPPGFSDVRTFIWNNCQVEVLYTYRTELDDEMMFERFLPSIRRQIKKGDKQDFKIHVPDSDLETSDVYDMIKTSYSRQGHTLRFNKDQFITFCQNPFIKQHLKTYVIWLGNIPVFSVVLLLDESTAYYWLAGGDSQYFSTGLNQVLLWNILQRLRSEGYSKFDFVGANTASISNYKSGYNFKLVPYYRISFESGKLAGQLMRVKRMLRGT